VPVAAAPDTLLISFRKWGMNQADQLQEKLKHDPAKTMTGLKNQMPLLPFYPCHTDVVHCINKKHFPLSLNLHAQKPFLWINAS